MKKKLLDNEETYTKDNYETILGDKEKDALQEAGNIAAAYAATALSKLVGENIMIDVTECKLTKVDNIPHSFGRWQQKIVAVNMLIPTRNLCSILMIFPNKSAMELCDMFTKKEKGTTSKISYKELLALTEIGNICICAYLNALSKLLDVSYMPTPPAVACDMLGSILQEVAVSADAINDYAILIETDFMHNQDSYKGHFLFIPDRESKEAIFKVFNIEKAN